MTGHPGAQRPEQRTSAGASVDVLAARWGAAAAWGFTALFVVSNATYIVLALTGPGQWRGVQYYLHTWTVLEFVP